MVKGSNSCNQFMLKESHVINMYASLLFVKLMSFCSVMFKINACTRMLCLFVFLGVFSLFSDFYESVSFKLRMLYFK